MNWDGAVVRSGWMVMEEGVDGERGVDGCRGRGGWIVKWDGVVVRSG